MTPDKCDHCSATLTSCYETILPADTPLKAEGKRRINIKIRCQTCGEFSPRVVELTK
jgi:hypothetical protein